MSYEDGWAAMNLEMPSRIPRTEYSAQGHWELIKAVTGIDVGVESPSEVKSNASLAFMRAWDISLFFGTLIGSGEFGETKTDMGHAEYAAGGVDRRDTVHCPFEDPEEVLSFDPWEVLGEQDRQTLVRRFEEHYQANCRARDFGVNMTGVYVTLVSGFIALFGWEMLLLAAGTDPERFGALANRYASWMQQYYDAIAQSDVPVIMMHDDMVWTEGAIFHPEWYREYVFPNYKRYLAPVIESGKKVLFCSDGDFTEFIDDLVSVGVHGFVFEPLTSLEYMAEKYGQTHVIVGNADTRVLLTGSKTEIRAEVQRCMSLGRKCPGFFMAVGNHIPANTPVQSAIYYNDVYEELRFR